jgi:hypothetical protein
MPSLLDQAREWITSAGSNLIRYAALALAAIVVLWIARKLLRRQRGPTVASLPTNLKIDVAALPESGPPPIPPTLEYYNLPVRLAAIVLAPAGRANELPSNDQLGPLLDAIVPGLDKVMHAHRPVIRRWPNQVSARGFAHLFFANVPLPGTAGKGTPWSSVAGIFKVNNQSVMAGLVLRAARPNGFGQTIVDSEEKWLGCLRVKWE